MQKNARTPKMMVEVHSMQTKKKVLKNNEIQHFLKLRAGRRQQSGSPGAP